MQYMDEVVLITNVHFIADKIKECLTRLDAIEEAIKTRQLPDAIGQPSEITIAPNVYDPMKVSTT